MNSVVFVNGVIMLFFAALMAVDALLFPATMQIFGVSALVVGTLGLCLAIAASGAGLNVRRLHTFILTATVWLTAALAGAVPLYLWQMAPVDAFFESMSGITTTGSTVLSGLDTMPRGILLWRAILQGLGGVGFIVTGIALLPMMRVGGMQLFRTESSDKGEKELTSAAGFATATLWVYLALIGLCAMTYMVGGMNTFDAVVHALTTLSTGGYSNYDSSFGHFQSPFLQWSGTLFMLCGGLPFAWYIRVIRQGRFFSEQVVAFLAGLAVAIAVIAGWLVINNIMAPLDALRLTAFNVVSVVTTTGYATTDYTVWGPFAVAMFMVLTAIGGCTGSTAGGAKVMRWLIFARSLKSMVIRVHQPNAVITTRYEGRAVEWDVTAGVISFFSFYFWTFAALAGALSFLGLDFNTAVSGALTALANVGPGVGTIIGPAGNFASLSDPAKALLIFGMYLGRLEMLTFFVLLAPRFWKEL